MMMMMMMTVMEMRGRGRGAADGTGGSKGPPEREDALVLPRSKGDGEVERGGCD